MSLCFLETHLGCLGVAVLLPKVAIDFHRESAAIRMSKPTGNRWDIHARFNAAGRKVVPEIVMGEGLDADLPTGGFHRP